MIRLRVGDWRVDVDEVLVHAAKPRVSLEPFIVAEAFGPPGLTLKCGRVSEAAVALGSGPPLEPGRYSVEGDSLTVESPTWNDRSSEAALKAAFLLATHRQGGLLLHASAVAFRCGAFLAVGPSEAGKSTLARLAVEAGGALLSEESVIVLPGRRLWATPFRSDYDAARTLLEARLAAVITLEKGGEERLTQIEASRGIELLLSQAYRPAPGEEGAGALLERAVHLALGPPALASFTFRNHANAGHFWAERLG